MTDDEIAAEQAVRQAAEELAEAGQCSRMLAKNGTALCPFCGAVFGTCGHPQGVQPSVA